MKFFNPLLIIMFCCIAFPSCSSLSPIWKARGNIQQNEQVDLKPHVKSGPDSACKTNLDRAFNAFNKDIPVLGGDLSDVADSLSQYQTCEEVKRDERIAEVLLKLLQRVNKLEAEVEELRAISIAPNP